MKTTSTPLVAFLCLEGGFMEREPSNHYERCMRILCFSLFYVLFDEVAAVIRNTAAFQELLQMAKQAFQ